MAEEKKLKSPAKWFREMKSELKKVVWPSKKQVFRNVLITVACVAVVALCIWLLDTASTFVVQGIISLVKG